MEKQKSSQLELFSRPKDPEVSNSHKFNINLLSSIRNYEKVILAIVVLIITSIVSFSLGVERGKKIIISDTQPSAAAVVGEAVSQEKEEKAKRPSPVEKKIYTIQLACYNTKDYAQKEAELLKKKGMSPSVQSKGRYIVLSVGAFSSKVLAQSQLAELKKRYKDCYVRRL